MHQVLQSLNATPGVVGSLVSSLDGRVLAHAFPAVFDDVALQEAATAVADGASGLETVTGPVQLLELRYAQTRVVAKPMPRGHLLLLCSATVNVQALVISLSVASKRLEKLIVAPEPEPPAAAIEPPAPEPAPAVESAVPAASAQPQRSKGKRKWFPSV